MSRHPEPARLPPATGAQCLWSGHRGPRPPLPTASGTRWGRDGNRPLSAGAAGRDFICTRILKVPSAAAARPLHQSAMCYLAQPGARTGAHSPPASLILSFERRLSPPAMRFPGGWPQRLSGDPHPHPLGPSPLCAPLCATVFVSLFSLAPFFPHTGKGSLLTTKAKKCHTKKECNNLLCKRLGRPR